MFDLLKTAQAAKDAQYFLAAADTKMKNTALVNIAKALLENADYIIEKNKKYFRGNVRQTTFNKRKN